MLGKFPRAKGIFSESNSFDEPLNKRYAIFISSND